MGNGYVGECGMMGKNQRVDTNKESIDKEIENQTGLIM